MTVTTVTKYFPLCLRPIYKGEGEGGGAVPRPSDEACHRTPIPTFPLEGGRRKKFAAVRRLTVLSGAFDDCMDARLHGWRR